eukprot:scaffold4470_cov99-Skeletonema_dohrnii-CCMP3373.AAC.8
MADGCGFRAEFRMRGSILELVFCVFHGNTYLQEPDQQLLKCCPSFICFMPIMPIHTAAIDHK